MGIFVQSRGKYQDDDYRWLRISKGGQRPEIPSILTRPIPGVPGTKVRITDLIESQTPSIVLARSDTELLLLVTGLEAKEERTDFMGTKIRNSVAWAGPDTDRDERILRALAVRALRGLLKEDIDKAVNFGGEYGFEVSYDLISEFPEPEEVETLNPDLTPQLGKNSLELKDSLASELQRHCLPQKDRVLVVVTGNRTIEALVKARVWRGLSNCVEAEGWLKLANETSDSDVATTRSGQNQPTSPSFFLLAIAVAAIAIILIALLAITIQTQHQTKHETIRVPTKVVPQISLPNGKLPQQVTESSELEPTQIVSPNSPEEELPQQTLQKNPPTE